MGGLFIFPLRAGDLGSRQGDADSRRTPSKKLPAGAYAVLTAEVAGGELVEPTEQGENSGGNAVGVLIVPPATSSVKTEPTLSFFFEHSFDLTNRNL